MTNPGPDNGQPQERPSHTTVSAVADIEKRFLRLTFWQTILSVAGVFTGAVALYAALTESQAVREQTAASVWPYVQYMINDTDTGDSASFALSLENVGVGPARMQGVLVTLNGEAVRDWQSLTSALIGRSAELGAEYGKSSINRRVLAPGDSVVAFQTQYTELALKFQEAIYQGALGLTYCYCSIFDECWSTSSGSKAGDDPLHAVTQCPDYGDKSFLD